MSRQLLNKFLIISFLLIWSVVGYKFISNVMGKERALNDTPLLAGKTLEIPNEKKDTFLISNISRDPFLGTYVKPKRETLPIINSVPSPRVSPQTLWPSIKYYGFVKGESSNDPLVLLKINNDLHRVRKGGKTEGLYIKEIFRDSISIANGKEKKIFKKE